MGKIKVSLISPTDINGGASIANYRLHKSLLLCPEIDSTLFVYQKYSQEKEIAQFSNLFLRLIETILNKFGYFSGLQYLFSFNWLFLFLKKRFRQSNVFIIGNIHGGYLPFWFPWLLSKIAPVVWQVYDMWSFTGHCAYSYDCQKFKQLCRACPYLKEYPGLFIDTTSFLFRLKRFFYSHSNLYVITSSRWMEENIKQSPILEKAEKLYIPTAVDTKILRFREKYNKLSLIAVLVNLNDKRKGGEIFPLILKILNEKLKEKNIFIDFYWVGLPAQTGKKNLSLLDFSNIKNIFLGNLNEEELAGYYSQCHAYLLPTLADNLPNTLLESLACETPAVCFNVGGCGDVIKYLETGYLAKQNDVNDFVAGILKVLENYGEMGKRGRNLILNGFTIEQQKEKYLDLIKSIVRNP